MEEFKDVGRLKGDVIWLYFRRMRLSVFGLYLTLNLVSRLSKTLIDYWLIGWAEGGQDSWIFRVVRSEAGGPGESRL